MKATDIRDSMAKDYLEPIINRLSERVRGEVVENFCIPHCGHPPTDGAFCKAAKQVYRSVLDLVMETASRLN